MYPETGNGGYTSIHTDVSPRLRRDRNRFLPGNHVDADDRATQCLSSLSLDFERSSANATAGPDMTVDSVTVDGQPATFTFVQPTYPGDPNGPGDPDPRAHEASQNARSEARRTTRCRRLLARAPAKKAQLRLARRDAMPGQQARDHASVADSQWRDFTVTVHYTGRPGRAQRRRRHHRGLVSHGGGSFVSTEPVGTEDWMPLNDYPSAKPTYDFYETVAEGHVAIANGMLLGNRRPTRASSAFPAGRRRGTGTRPRRSRAISCRAVSATTR